MIAVMTVDPGGKSGIAYGIYDFKPGRLAADITREAVAREDVWAEEIEGTYWEQANEIAEAWSAFANRQRRLRKITDMRLVIESFELRKRTVDLSPVEVASGIVSVLDVEFEVGDPEVVSWQTSSDAHAIDSRRLRAFGLFDLGRGSEHKRDALRHQVVYLFRRLDAAR